MWLFTTRGFYSVVEDRQDPSGQTLLVRGRAREDLEALLDLLPGIEVRETPGSDYRFRTSIPRAVFAGLAFGLAREVDYPNFKREIAECTGSDRARLYGNVWAEMLTLQRP